MSSIKNQNIMERWFAGIGGADGQGEKVLRDFMARVEAANIPGIAARKKTLSVGLVSGLKGMFRGGGGSKPREFIEIENEKLPGYLIYAGTRDYGKQLLVSWYLVTNERKLNRVARMMGQITNMMDLDIYKTEELSAFVSLVHEALKAAVEASMKELNLDFTKVDTHTHGFLNIS